MKRARLGRWHLSVALAYSTQLLQRRNEKSPFRALTHPICFVFALFVQIVEMKRARLGRWHISTVLTYYPVICRNEKSPFRALTRFKIFLHFRQVSRRNEKSPFRALTQYTHIPFVILLFCRNEESPFRALTLARACNFQLRRNEENPPGS